MVRYDIHRFGMISYLTSLFAHTLSQENIFQVFAWLHCGHNLYSIVMMISCVTQFSNFRLHVHKIQVALETSANKDT